MGWRNCKMEAIILWSGILSPPCCSVPPPTQVDTVGGSCASNANITCSLLNVLSSKWLNFFLRFIIIIKELFGQDIQLVFIESYPNIFHISESALRVLSIFYLCNNWTCQKSPTFYYKRFDWDNFSFRRQNNHSSVLMRRMISANSALHESTAQLSLRGISGLCSDALAARNAKPSLRAWTSPPYP